VDKFQNEILTQGQMSLFRSCEFQKSLFLRGENLCIFSRPYYASYVKYFCTLKESNCSYVSNYTYEETKCAFYIRLKYQLTIRLSMYNFSENAAVPRCWNVVMLTALYWREILSALIAMYVVIYRRYTDITERSNLSAVDSTCIN